MNEEINPNEVQSLEELRNANGNEACKQTFAAMCSTNPERAAELLNQGDTSFPCLFAVLPEVRANALEGNLSANSNIAACVVNQIENENAVEDYLSEKSEENAAVLRWILETGYNDYSLGDGYLKVLDIVSAVLIITYEEKSILPLVENMIFERHRRGLCIHDLVWAFFRMEDFSVMKMVAGHLNAGDENEANFAANLLHLPDNGPGNRAAQYEEYVNWLEENEPFLFFTYEGMQYTSEPNVVDVDQERKYMHKTSRIFGYDPLEADNENEQACLLEFRELKNSEQKALSNYSHKIYRENQQAWQEWMSRPVSQQLEAARAGEEGMV
ncbi:MAG: hypothetical protein LBS36_06870 [Oscillospiraceae bacterium]|jgi:hypothetical protein|nr:hypothetical protein [Oscillospiraceae bacterium]